MRLIREHMKLNVFMFFVQYCPTAWGKTSSSSVCLIAWKSCYSASGEQNTKGSVFDICHRLTATPHLMSYFQSGWPGSWQICPLPTTPSSSSMLTLKQCPTMCPNKTTKQCNTVQQHAVHSGVEWLVFVCCERLMLQFHAAQWQKAETKNWKVELKVWVR